MNRRNVSNQNASITEAIRSMDGKLVQLGILCTVVDLDTRLDQFNTNGFSLYAASNKEVHVVQIF